MSSDPPDGLADTRQPGPEDKVNLPSDPMADTAAGFADRPSSDDAVRDAAERASVRAKLFASSRAEEAPKVGRYAVLNVLGEGGMGTVYACYDDQLDRRVALKLIKTAESSDSRRRMLREAQAMAKLSHPNVVPVFEVGEHDGQLFVAMEYIRGATLKAWQTEEERPWREVIGKYLQAGRGLAAAHAQGLVHRDFKPDNAVVGNDGRVRVLDFGLAAKRGEQAVADTHVTVMPQAKDAALDTPLTVTGTVMGTPAYMPPEQFMSGVVDARSDQFSFCVALWEGLYGERPFDGKTSTELFTRIAQGKVAEPKGTEVPAAVRGALERGLKSSAEERWPDLASLLDAIESFGPTASARSLVGSGADAAFGAIVAAVPWMLLGYVEWWVDTSASAESPSSIAAIVVGGLVIVGAPTATLVNFVSQDALHNSDRPPSWGKVAGLSWPWVGIVLLLILTLIVAEDWGAGFIATPPTVGIAMPLALWGLQGSLKRISWRPARIGWAVLLPIVLLAPVYVLVRAVGLGIPPSRLAFAFCGVVATGVAVAFDAHTRGRRRQTSAQRKKNAAF